jgi:hypothetical protein
MRSSDDVANAMNVLLKRVSIHAYKIDIEGWYVRLPRRFFSKLKEVLHITIANFEALSFFFVRNAPILHRSCIGCLEMLSGV